MRVSVPGKLLLFGEHAAVFGYPAVGMALSRGLTVALQPSKTADATSQPLTIEIGDTKEIPDTVIQRFVAHIETVARSFALSPLAGAITVTSELPIGSGFGSSAALCTAIARLLAPNSRDPHTTWRIAHELERFFHGTPSGIDTGLTTLGGVQAFHFEASDAPRRSNPSVDYAPLPATVAVHLPDCVLTVGSIPRERSTKELVALVGEQRRRAPDTVDAMLSQLGALGETLLRGDSTDSADHTVSFGRAASEAQTILRELGVSTSKLDEILEIGVKAGAVGGKLSGAGGGGAFYLVCAGEEEASRVRRGIEPVVTGAGGTVFSVATGR